MESKAEDVTSTDKELEGHFTNIFNAISFKNQQGKPFEEYTIEELKSFYDTFLRNDNNFPEYILKLKGTLQTELEELTKQPEAYERNLFKLPTTGLHTNSKKHVATLLENYMRDVTDYSSTKISVKPQVEQDSIIQSALNSVLNTVRSQDIVLVSAAAIATYLSGILSSIFQFFAADVAPNFDISQYANQLAQQAAAHAGNAAVNIAAFTPVFLRELNRIRIRR